MISPEQMEKYLISLMDNQWKGYFIKIKMEVATTVKRQCSINILNYYTYLMILEMNAK